VLITYSAPDYLVSFSIIPTIYMILCEDAVAFTSEVGGVTITT
jgi:hypothetical protein